MNNAQQNKYLEMTVQTATPMQLLLMLCDGAVRFCKLGIESIHQKKYDATSYNLCRVQDIITELRITLDMESPIAAGLSSLYEYMNRRLVEANIKKDPEIAAEVLGYLQELKQTWQEAAKQIKSAGQMDAAREPGTGAAQYG